MSNNQIQKKFIGEKQVGAGQILIERDEALMAVDGADNEVELLKINASGDAEILGAQVVVLDGTGKVPAAQLPANESWTKQTFTLTSTDVTNQYIDLSGEARPGTIMAYVSRLAIHETADYTTSLVGGVTRLTFTGEIATGGNSALASGDKVFVQYAE